MSRKLSIIRSSYSHRHLLSSKHTMASIRSRFTAVKNALQRYRRSTKSKKVKMPPHQHFYPADLLKTQQSLFINLKIHYITVITPAFCSRIIERVLRVICRPNAIYTDRLMFLFPTNSLTFNKITCTKNMNIHCTLWSACRTCVSANNVKRIGREFPMLHIMPSPRAKPRVIQRLICKDRAILNDLYSPQEEQKRSAISKDRRIRWLTIPGIVDTSI